MDPGVETLKEAVNQEFIITSCDSFCFYFFDGYCLYVPACVVRALVDVVLCLNFCFAYAAHGCGIVSGVNFM